MYYADLQVEKDFSTHTPGEKEKALEIMITKGMRENRRWIWENRIALNE